MAKGKIIGAIGGFVLGGPLGALLGFCVGAAFDSGGAQLLLDNQSLFSSGNDSRQFSYQVSLLTLMAAVMQANGMTKRSELDYVKVYIRKSFLNEEDQRKALLLLKEMLDQNIDIQAICNQVNGLTNVYQRRQIISYLFGVGCADGELDQNEEKLIRRIATLMGISREDFNFMKYWELNGRRENMGNNGSSSSYGGSRSSNQNSGQQRAESSNSTKLKQAYATLGVAPSVTDAELRKAYHDLVRKNHPDRYASSGEEVVAEMTQKVKAINDAYTYVTNQRANKQK